MVKGNGFAPHRMISESPHAPRYLGRFKFMIRTVLLTALLFLCGQTASSQCALVCNNSISVALDNAGNTTIYPPMLLQSSNGCSNNFTITIVDENGGQHGQQLNASLIDQVLVATITHPASGNSCNTNITLIDNLPPVVDCSNDTIFIWCNTPLNSIATPSVTDNVSPADSIEFTFADILTDLGCNDSIGNVPVTAYLQLDSHRRARKQHAVLAAYFPEKGDAANRGIPEAP
jgi:hypothetical protein